MYVLTQQKRDTVKTLLGKSVSQHDIHHKHGHLLPAAKRLLEILTAQGREKIAKRAGKLSGNFSCAR